MKFITLPFTKKKRSTERPSHKFENKTLCLILNLVITSDKLYFHSLHQRFKFTANKHRELNFWHKFYPFMQVWGCIG